MNVRHSPQLQQFLSSYEVDGTTVAAALFDGGRLWYPGRRELEHALGYTEPYTLEHESRVIDELPAPVAKAIRLLARSAPSVLPELDPTLELLWEAHASWVPPSPLIVAGDRLVAALVTTHAISEVGSPPEQFVGGELAMAALRLITFMQSTGFPPSSAALEEIFDGAPPACVGLGLVDIDWKGP